MGSQKFSAALNGSEQGGRKMQFSREQFMEPGYLALREVIPPARLEKLRADFETQVGRRRRIWAQERGPDDPRGDDLETRP